MPSRRPAVGDAQPLARKRAADRLEDGAAGQHEIGALGADAGIGDAAFVAHGEQPLDHARDLRVAHPAAVDAAAVVARQIEMDAGDRRHRARGAEQVQPRGAAVLGARSGRRRPRPPRPSPRTLRRHRDAAVAFGERHDADRQRDPGARSPGAAGRASVGAAAAEPDELRGAAADVEQDGAVGRRVDQRRAAGGGEPRLGFAIDDLKLDADLVADALEEVEAVAGRAAGLRRDQPRAGDAAVSHLGAADAAVPRSRAPSPPR